MAGPTIVGTGQDPVSTVVGTAVSLDISVNFSDSVTPTQQLRFNDVDVTYIQIPEWAGTEGDTVAFTFIPSALPAATRVLLNYSTGSEGLRLVLGNNYKLRVNYKATNSTTITAMVWSAETITEGVTYTGYFLPTAGGAELWMEVAGTPTKVVENTTNPPDMTLWKLNYIGSTTIPFNGVIKDVVLTKTGDTRNYPINDGYAAGADNIDDTGTGDVDGTTYNVTSDNWETVV